MKRSTSVLLFLALVLTGTTAKGSAQDVLFEYRPTTPGDDLGYRVGATGDFDGDGVPDFALASYLLGLRIHSGLTGATLQELPSGNPPVQPAGDVNGDGIEDFLAWQILRSGQSGEPRAAFFGWTVVPLPDIDGDGRPEFLTGFSGFQIKCLGHVIKVYTQLRPGEAYVFSGDVDHHPFPVVLYALEGEEEEDAFGGVLGRIDDVDGDGLEDFVIGASLHADCTRVGDGFLQAHSSASGERLWRADGHAAALEAIDDVDGDGLRDFVVGSPFDEMVEYRSSADGQVLFEVNGPVFAGLFGYSVSSLPDVDGDGLRDVLVGAPQAPYYGPGFVQLLSGADGSLISQYEGDGTIDRFGESVAGLGDLNGDGFPDFVAGGPGLARVFSSAPLTFSSDTHELSLPGGAAQNLTLDAGPALAGSTYLVLGSATGVAPQGSIAGVHVPLVFDEYTLLTLPGTPRGPLVGGFSTLDAQGRASIGFVPPPSTPALLGRTLFHAALVLEPASSRKRSFDRDVALVSPAVPVTLGL